MHWRRALLLLAALVVACTTVNVVTAPGSRIDSSSTTDVDLKRQKGRDDDQR